MLLPLKDQGITFTIYKLKHFHSDRIMAALGAKIAAGQNAHLSTRMVDEVYGYNARLRQHEELKNIDVRL